MGYHKVPSQARLLNEFAYPFPSLDIYWLHQQREKKGGFHHYFLEPVWKFSFLKGDSALPFKKLEESIRGPKPRFQLFLALFTTLTILLM